MATIHTIEGGGGLKLHVREWGDASAPAILFIHGWSQNHLCWTKQFDSNLTDQFRIVALDLRGHGQSESPHAVEHYNNSQLWADDIKAIIDGLALSKTVLCGWSYGGLVIADYVRIHGTDNIGAINFVGAAPALNENALGTYIGPGFYENFEACTNPDLAISLPGIAKFVRDCFEIAPTQAEFEILLGFNAVVTPDVRANLAARDLDNSDLFGDIDVPVLVSHGREDRVVLPSSGELFFESCPKSTVCWHDGVGHAPFFEDPETYNNAIANLATGL
ncbi:MAG: alpha/beta hydrolase [Pseudomonadota bacterium]